LHLYLHIPFCHQACHYCDFHFSTNTAYKSDLVNAICREIALQKDYLSDKGLKTIYFGGGTPSLLSAVELEQILDTIQQYFSVENEAEITLEANPEDLTSTYLSDLKTLGVNRLSIGIQSFREENLRFLNRNHSSAQALTCISKAQDIGIDNISIDLIYGIPGNDLHDLALDINKAVDTKVNHISAYSLTIEPKTVFGQQKKKGVFKELPEAIQSQKFSFTRNLLAEKGFEAYETSNFAKNQQYSKHNTSYWNQESYLGIGPSAHSFNQVSRQWNVAKNGIYTKAINEGSIPSEIEILTEANKINEYIMTRLRTKWGIECSKIEQAFSQLKVQAPNDLFKIWQNNDWAHVSNGHLILTETGALMADKLAADLFIV
jgi:oxygen-independent coproporphyrinogen-3 oxidase